MVLAFMEGLKPDRLWTGVGGTGLAFEFSSGRGGPTILLRAELDALPIHESGTSPHRSSVDGVSHACGHDGHMATLAAVAMSLAHTRPTSGRVILLFQPAEETGQGARLVQASPSFPEFEPDWAFAIHNLPGFPLGQVVIRPGPFNAASRGMVIRLKGAPAHAAQPETGVSPVPAVSQILDALSGLGPQRKGDPIRMVTVVGCQVGEMAFGTAPGQADVWATLRTQTNEMMEDLMGQAEELVRKAASDHGLSLEIEYQDVFSATTNSDAAVEVVLAAAENEPSLIPPEPFRWSEDFGVLIEGREGALIGLGAGEHHPALHDEDYDFPDALIPLGAGLLLRIVASLSGSDVPDR